jgi:glutamine cyclotransferase
MKNIIFCLALSVIPISGAYTDSSLSDTKLSDGKSIELRKIAQYPHDKRAFTQGLFFEDGCLYESTGGYGASSLRKTEPETGEVVTQVTIPSKYFAEGLERVGGQIFQLTWQEGYCFVYDKATLNYIDSFRYSGEGWGLTFDGEYLILSDGSARLRFFDPKTFKQKHKIDVTECDPKTKKTISVKKLNELEFIHGEIWANVWQTADIVRINPQTGNVIGRIHFDNFIPEEYRAELNGPIVERNHVLNGIAFDPKTNRIFITGKNWPVLYVLQIVDP